MAGIFGSFSYSGKGEAPNPDETPKAPLLVFLAIVGRKFWKICTINLMYVLLSLPIIFLGLLGEIFFLQVVAPQLNFAVLDGTDARQMITALIMSSMLLTGLSLMIAGPVHAGTTYLLRNYAQEKHAFIWMDFKDHARKNLKQSLVSALISLVFTVLCAVNFAFFNLEVRIASDSLRIFIQIVIAVIFILWCVIQMYLYPMMVAYKLSLKHLYKNCLIFTFLRLPLNLLILLGSFTIMFIVPLALLMFNIGLTTILAMAWYVFLAFGLNLLLTNFYVARVLDKYMLQQIKT